MEVIVTTKTPKAVSDLIDSLGEVLSGNSPDSHGLKEVFWSAFAHSLATSVHQAFLIKSAHGTDELGEKWPDLDPKTKAYGRKEGRVGLPLYRGKPTLYGNTHRPTLTKEQDKEWRRVFVMRLVFLRTQIDDREATSAAAAIAWDHVKKTMGAKTILAYAKDRIMLLLQKSGRLEKSLRPGTLSGEKYNPPPEQVSRLDKSELTWGTGVEYASRVHTKRPFWPKNIDPWITRAVEAGIQSVIKKLKDIL